jgi:hypothetical protein
MKRTKRSLIGLLCLVLVFTCMPAVFTRPVGASQAQAVTYRSTISAGTHGLAIKDDGTLWTCAYVLLSVHTKQSFL